MTIVWPVLYFSIAGLYSDIIIKLSCFSYVKLEIIVASCSELNPWTGLGSLTPGANVDKIHDKSMETAVLSPSLLTSRYYLSSALASRISFW